MSPIINVYNLFKWRRRLRPAWQFDKKAFVEWNVITWPKCRIDKQHEIAGSRYDQKTFFFISNLPSCIKLGSRPTTSSIAAKSIGRKFWASKIRTNFARSLAFLGIFSRSREMFFYVSRFDFLASLIFPIFVWDRAVINVVDWSADLDWPHSFSQKRAVPKRRRRNKIPSLESIEIDR